MNEYDITYTYPKKIGDAGYTTDLLSHILVDSASILF